MLYQNIKKNHTKRLDSKIYSGHYYDYMLYKGETIQQTLSDINNMAIADFSTLNIIDGILYSTVTWPDAINNGVRLCDIGLTGIDNGFLSYDKDKISNQQFLDIFLHSHFEIEENDTRLFMTPVTGNTQNHVYPMYFINDDNGEDYISCRGGFYQGFFKLKGYDYQVLPSDFGKDMLMHFEIRPRSDYKVENKTVNELHPENNGIFFFMGTRAENKFWPLYNVSSALTCSLIRDDDSMNSYLTSCDGTNDGYLMDDSSVIGVLEWLKDEDYYKNDGNNENNETTSGSTENITNLLNEKFSQTFLNTYDFNEYNICKCNDCNHIIIDKNENEEIINSCNGGKKSIEEDYVMADVSVSEGPKITDSEGHELDKKGYYEITESDNKFLMFDRTENGYTVDNWEEGTTVTLTGRKDWPSANYFLLMNRTDTGYTVHNIDQYNENHGSDYNIYKDIRNNVFALRITENGAIGYRYGVLDCEDETSNKYKVIEEYSKDGMVKMDQWNSINVRFVIINPKINKCDMRPRKMKLMIYVNGFLKLISKELDAFNFKDLDDVYQKQEGVPYSISLGGGTQGLLETILPEYYKISSYMLPIEKDFCGTFLGDIKSFKIYEGFIDYYSIKRYLS